MSAIAPIDAKALRNWIQGWEATARLLRQEQRHRGPRPAESIDAGFALIDFVGLSQGWPPPENALFERGRRQAELAWTRLKAASARP